MQQREVSAPPKKPKTNSGLGSLAAGVLGAVVATGAGLDEDEALGVGQDAADTVRTGAPTTRSTAAAIDRTRAAQEAALAAEQGAVTDTQRAIEEKLRQQEETRQRERLRQQQEARHGSWRASRPQTPRC